MNIQYKLTLEAARKNLGYSQEDVAKLVGVHPQTISAWEKDSSKLSVVESNKLAEIYRIPANLLFLGKKNEFIRRMREKETV